MFKRMSVLVRRPNHTRATFSSLWEQHAAPVSQLPRVRGYIQNHIEEDFSGEPPILADGFVELLWDRPEDMVAAFADEAARPMVEDEPGFLGHGSGYALAGAEWRFEPHAGKVIIAALGDCSKVDRAVIRLLGLQARLRDDVTTLIAKPGMAPPQRVDAFFHLWFDDVETARDAAIRAAELSDGAVTLGVYRVRTRRFV